MKEIMETIERELSLKVTGIKKETRVMLGIVFGVVVVFGVYNMGYHFGEYLYYLVH